MNPVSFFLLARELSEDWAQLKKMFRKSTSNSSPLIFDWDGARPFLKPNFARRDREKQEVFVDNQYLIHSDIQRYYHTIYTHSIAWALHGKAIAKKNFNGINLLGNRLDFFARNAQDGQTIGIPVGPETSRVIAEIVGTAIDLAVTEKIDRQSYRRFVDDLIVGAETRSDCDRAHTVIRRAVIGFELELNEEKTRIEESNYVNFDSWRYAVRNTMPGVAANRKAWETYFDTVSELAQRHSGENVLNYTLRSARSVFSSCIEWNLVEDYLLIMYRKDPSNLRVISEIFVTRNFTRGDVNKHKVERFIKRVLPSLLENDRYGESAWLLFLCKALKIQLRNKNIEPLFQANSGMNALLLCDLERIDLLPDGIDRTHWNTSLDNAGLRSQFWMYAYEATLKGWTTAGDTHVTGDAYFSELYKRKISFYNENRNFKILETRLRQEYDQARKTLWAFEALADEVDFDTFELNKIDEYDDDIDESDFIDFADDVDFY